MSANGASCLENMLTIGIAKVANNLYLTKNIGQKMWLNLYLRKKVVFFVETMLVGNVFPMCVICEELFAVRRHAIGHNVSHRPRSLKVEAARDGIDIEHLACEIQVGVFFYGQCV